MTRTIATRVRAAWRPYFAPEPPIRLDGVWIQVGTRMRPESWSMTSAAEALATAYRATYDSETPAGQEDHEFAADLIAGLADKGFQVVLIPENDQPVPATPDRWEYWMRQLSLPVEATYSQVVPAVAEIGSLNTRRAINGVLRRPVGLAIGMRPPCH